MEKERGRDWRGEEGRERERYNVEKELGDSGDIKPTKRHRESEEERHVCFKGDI
jgi:hypothetical protein